jgi:AcrR family transcriptional regulator
MIQRFMPVRIPKKGGSQRRTEQTRERIRRAALQLFRTYGFKKVTIREIAREADVSQVTIYNCFGSKDGLIRDVVKCVFRDAVDKYRAIMEDGRPFMEKLEDIIMDKMEMGGQYRGEMIQRALSDDPEMLEFVSNLYDGEIKQTMLNFFEEGKRQGCLNPDLSQEAIMLYSEIFRDGLMARPNLRAESKRSLGLMRELTTLYLYGVMGKPLKQSCSIDMRERGQNGR